MEYPVIRLKRDKEKVARGGHPWIFEGALARDGRPSEAGPVELRNHAGGFVAVGTYNPKSALAVRLLRRDPGPLDREYFRRRFEEARALRAEILRSDETNAYRLVHGEGDSLSGLVVDAFAGHLVVQVGTPGMAALAGEWLTALVETLEPESITARPDQGAGNRERFEPPRGLLHGTAPERIRFRENGVLFNLTLGAGQKTGFYCDQRENRARVAGLSEGRRVLDAFCYTGGFALTALAAGAREAVGIDSSQPALEAGRSNGDLAGVAARLELVRGDCHEYLRGGSADFGVVVVDPPALAKKRRDTERAARAYKDLFLHGLRRVELGGYALLCSCSAAVDRRLFDQIVAGAARDSGRRAQILERRGAGPDHPVSTTHPEGEYLKATLLRVL